MRILSIALVVEKARLGNTAFLEETVRELLLSQKKNQRFKGFQDDIIDLILGWADVIGKEKILEDPSLLFNTFIYDIRDREIFSKVITYLYPTLIWDKEKSSQFRKFLDEGER